MMHESKCNIQIRRPKDDMSTRGQTVVLPSAVMLYDQILKFAIVKFKNILKFKRFLISKISY